MLEKYYQKILEEYQCLKEETQVHVCDVGNYIEINHIEQNDVDEKDRLGEKLKNKLQFLSDE